MKRLLGGILFLFPGVLFAQETAEKSTTSSSHGLHFTSLAKRWDEGIPLGNGWLGALIWQKDDKIRLSLDRVDLWDDRPMPVIDQLKFSWVVEQVKKGQYDTVQKIGDAPYEKYPAPTKIPGAALEFDFPGNSKVISNDLDISNGLSRIVFENGTVFQNYIHASRETGYFSFSNFSDTAALPFLLTPKLIAPAYTLPKQNDQGNSVSGQGLQQLGYLQGRITRLNNSLRYHQPTYDGNYYQVLVNWTWVDRKTLIGQWTISNNKPASLPRLDTHAKEPTSWPLHLAWWKNYWSKSSISIPDPLLEKQYYLEMYKFACVTRPTTPPISLQAIWTADNGNLPPWKGDFHHDLNTQLSYWPGYVSNHLDLTASYTNWLWGTRETNKAWTRSYFNLDGLNVPGVTTISGKEMGGWIQYSMSPTTAAWLAQHFYWQWKYSMDDAFLKNKALVYIMDVATFMERLTAGEGGHRQIPLSSSPEYFDNSIKAWFTDFTSYDLSLIYNLFEMARVVRTAEGRIDLSKLWTKFQKELPSFATNNSGLMVAREQEMSESHRHFSPYMAIYPLKMLSVYQPTQKEIMENSIRQIEKLGTREWCGYSFSWMSCIYARAKQGDSAARQLQIFASNFCSPNSFHLNGDQKGGQYSNFTYRPFTLEGNFAFAQGIQEMLLQTDQGVVEIFPAIPKGWKNVSFRDLRSEGAFLFTAKKENGTIDKVLIKSVKGGVVKFRLPFPTFFIREPGKKFSVEDGVMSISMKAGEQVIVRNGYE